MLNAPPGSAMPDLLGPIDTHQTYFAWKRIFLLSLFSTYRKYMISSLECSPFLVILKRGIFSSGMSPSVILKVSRVKITRYRFHEPKNSFAISLPFISSNPDISAHFFQNLFNNQSNSFILVTFMFDYSCDVLRRS